MFSLLAKYSLILGSAFIVVFGNVALSSWQVAGIDGLPRRQQSSQKNSLEQVNLIQRDSDDAIERWDTYMRPMLVLTKQGSFPVSVSSSDSVAAASSPVVADVDNDGDYELFMAGYTWSGGPTNSAKVYGWDHTGTLLSGFPVSSGDTKVVASLAAADLDNDGDLEIIAGTSDTSKSHNRARVFAWHHNGTLVSGWPRGTQWNDSEAASWAWNEVTSVAVADIDDDNQNEVLAVTTANTTRSSGSDPAYNAYAWEADGTPISGWPTTAGSWTMYDNRVGIYGLLALGDFNGDNKANPVFGRDYNIMYAYDASGSPLSNWPILTFKITDTQNGVWADGDDPIEMGIAAPVLADLDGDGNMEMITLGYRRDENDSTPLNSALLVYNSDASRRSGWETPAEGSGWIEDQACAPYGIPSVANLDGDDELEIIASTNDGYIRAYNHDKSLLWAYNYAQGKSIIAGEVIVGDIDGDYEVELIFGSYEWDLDNSGDAKIFVLEKDGTPSADPNFPITDIGDKEEGLCATPALADLDQDGDVELIVPRKADTEQLAVYDLPGAYHPYKMPWPQARHDAQRTATYIDPIPNLIPSKYRFLDAGADYNEIVNFSAHVQNGGGSLITDSLTVTVKIPSQLVDIQNIQVTPDVGTVVTSTDALTWVGILPTTQKVTINYGVRVSTTERLVLSSPMTITHPTLGPVYRNVLFITNPLYSYLPIILRKH